MPFSKEKRRNLRRKLLCWYDANARKLPWRQTRDPYRIWISEIMLQQTRVAVVIERYGRFLRKFPSIRDLARARDSAVLAEWSGLGYYQRARNLHAAAKLIMRHHDGVFPCSADALRELPGIGRYTAAAIASIAFKEPVAVVDGNVERVLARLESRRLAGEQSWSTAQDLLDVERPGDFNQAMMELGATVCVPANPRCMECPINKFCGTRGRGQICEPTPRQQRREIVYVLARRGKSVFLVRREAHHGLMPGMWELPEARLGKNDITPIMFSLNHSITTTDYKVRVIRLADAARCAARSDRDSGRWVNMARILHIPLTGLTRKILRRAELI